MRSSVRSLRAVVVLLAALLAVTGCVGLEPNPTDYGEVNPDNDGYYGTFMFGCTGVEANEDGEYADWTLENPEFCTCVFEGLKDRVPFSEMQALEEDQAEAEPGEFELPRNVNTVREGCSRLA